MFDVTRLKECEGARTKGESIIYFKVFSDNNCGSIFGWQ